MKTSPDDRRPSAPPSTIDEQLTLVIPTVGRPILERSLAAIVGGTRLPARIIVVDQSASEEVAALLDPAGARGIETTHLPSRQRGRALALNRGLEQVNGRFVAVTDDDCLVDVAWVERMGRHLRERPRRIFTGRVLSGGAEPVLGTVTAAVGSVATRPALVFDRLSGGNLGMSIETVRRVGLFDEDPCVRHAEDGEWAYRALSSGVEIAFEPDLVVTHLGWRQEEQRLDQYLGYARSHAAFFGKYLRRGDAFMLMRAGVHLLRSARRWLTGVMRHDRELASNGRSYVAQFFPGLAAGLRSSIRAPSLPPARPSTSEESEP